MGSPSKKFRIAICDGINYGTSMERCKIVIDTNILISALISRRGAAFKLLSLIGKQYFDLVLSVPLIIEYEDVLKRKNSKVMVSREANDHILDRMCYHAELREIFYLWRPYLTDPKDDLVLEVAVEANCSHIITYNIRHFKEIGRFGLEAVTPKSFLQKIGVIE